MIIYIVIILQISLLTCWHCFQIVENGASIENYQAGNPSQQWDITKDYIMNRMEKDSIVAVELETKKVLKVKTKPGFREDQGLPHQMWAVVWP